MWHRLGFCCDFGRWKRGDLGQSRIWWGDSSRVQDQLRNVRQIRGAAGAFAAALADGRVATGAVRTLVATALQSKHSLATSTCLAKMRKVQGVGKLSAPSNLHILLTQQYVSVRPFLVLSIAVEICPTGDTWICIKTMAIRELLGS